MLSERVMHNNAFLIPIHLNNSINLITLINDHHAHNNTNLWCRSWAAVSLKNNLRVRVNIFIKIIYLDLS